MLRSRRREILLGTRLLERGTRLIGQFRTRHCWLVQVRRVGANFDGDQAQSSGDTPGQIPDTVTICSPITCHFLLTCLMQSHVLFRQYRWTSSLRRTCCRYGKQAYRTWQLFDARTRANGNIGVFFKDTKNYLAFFVIVGSKGQSPCVLLESRMGNLNLVDVPLAVSEKFERKWRRV